MKGKRYVSKTNRRRRSNNCRVCNHHFGCCWFCRLAIEHSAFKRSKTDAFRSDSFCNKHTTSKLVSEVGSVTAEFALIVPAALLILILAISTLSFQTQRNYLVEATAAGARELARGETTTSLDELLSEYKLNPRVAIEHRNFLVCLELTIQAKLSWLGSIPISERQCARKSGL